MDIWPAAIYITTLYKGRYSEYPEHRQCSNHICNIPMQHHYFWLKQYCLRPCKETHLETEEKNSWYHTLRPNCLKLKICSSEMQCLLQYTGIWSFLPARPHSYLVFWTSFNTHPNPSFFLFVLKLSFLYEEVSPSFSWILEGMELKEKQMGNKTASHQASTNSCNEFCCSRDWVHL